jgi:phospholipid/cholesterol/gamma-HCH transport system substrate-binding protein
MKDEKKTEVIVGVTIFIALIIFVLIFGWAKNFSLSASKYELNVSFKNVAGLEKGDLVSVNGVRKGLVESITSLNNSALVKINFDENPNLKEDADFAIMMLDLMGGKKIEISNGVSSNEIDFSKTYYGHFSGDISTAMGTLNSVEDDLIALVKDLRKPLDFVNKNFTNDEFSSSVNSTLSNLKTLTSNLNELISSNKTGVKELISNTNELAAESKDLLKSNKDQIKELLQASKLTMENADSLLKKINTITDQTIAQKNNIGKLLYDENLFTELKNSLQQINKLTTTLNKQLENGGLEVKADVDLF